MSRRGLLLVNLGTPRSTDPRDVRAFLEEFLGDPLVLGGVLPLRMALVKGIIGPLRSPKSAKAYETIWTERGSPILFHGIDLRERVAERLPGIPVRLAMRYQTPGVAEALSELRDEGVEELTVLPLFPQYSSTTTLSVVRAVERQAARLAPGMRLRFVRDFYEHPAFVEAQAAAARPVLERVRPERVVFSYHGVPEAYLKKDDPGGSRCLWSPDCCAVLDEGNRWCYRAQCYATSRALSRALGLAPEDAITTFQSRFGPQTWARPYTDRSVEALAAAGCRRVVVLCPAFVADCLETLEEIGVALRESFLEAGGEVLEAAPCVNSDPLWAAGVVRLFEEAAALEEPADAPR